MKLVASTGTARTGTQRGIQSLAVSDDAIACGGWGDDAFVFDTRGRELAYFAHADSVPAVAFTGKHLITASGPLVRVWSLATRKAVRTLEHDAEIKVIAASADGKRVATGGEHDGVAVWSLASGKRIATIDFSRPQALALSSNGAEIALADWDAVEVRTVDNGTQLWRKRMASVHTLTFAGKKLTCLGKKAVAADARSATTLVPGTVRSISTNGKHALVGEYALWDAATGKRKKLDLWRTDGNCAAFSPNGKLLAAGGLSGRLRIWDTRSAQRVDANEGRGTVSVLAAQDDRVLSGCHEGHVFAWDGRAAADLERAPKRIGDWIVDQVIAVAHEGGAMWSCHADGRICGTRDLRIDKQLRTAVFIGDVMIGFESNGTAHRVALDSGVVTAIGNHEGHFFSATTVDHAVRAGARVFSVGGGSLALWSVDGKRLARWNGDGSIAAATDKLAFVSDDDGAIHVWELARRSRIDTFGALVPAPLALAVSADGRHLACCGRRGEIVIADSSSGRERDRFVLSGDAAASACFAGRDLVVGTVRGLVHRFEI